MYGNFLTSHKKGDSIMKILLINENSSVSKLIGLTAKKYDYEIVEITDPTELEKAEYDIVLIDDQMEDLIDINSLKDKILTDEIVYIASKDKIKPDGYKHILTKPFLPSDFHDLIESIKTLKRAIDEEMVDEEIVNESGLELPKTSVVKEETEESTDNIEKEVENSFEDLDLDEELELEEEKIDEDLFIDNEDEILKESAIDNEEEEQLSQEPGTSILDKDEIEEVKGLLDDDPDIDLKEEDAKSPDNIDIDPELKDDEIPASDELDLNETDAEDSKEYDLDSDIEEGERKVEDVAYDEDVENINDLSLDDLDMEDMSDDGNSSEQNEGFDIDDMSIDNDEITEEEHKVEDIPYDEEIGDSETVLADDLNLEEVNDEKKESDFDDVGEETDEATRVAENIKKDIRTKEDDEKDELDDIKEESLQELFGEKEIGEIDKSIEADEAIDDKEEDMIMEAEEELKPKSKKKKKKKIKQEELANLKEEITAKLLDIDTLREVLDGMEIRIKFYNKSKK